MAIYNKIYAIEFCIAFSPVAIIDVYVCVCVSVYVCVCVSVYDEHLNRLTSHIKEVLSIRDGRELVCPGFNNADINYIVKYLCTC